MLEETLPPCRCCGGQPEQLYFFSGSKEPLPVHGCKNCGFKITANNPSDCSEDLWIKANEKHNPFLVGSQMTAIS